VIAWARSLAPPSEKKGQEKYLFEVDISSGSLVEVSARAQEPLILPMVQATN
jgi:hypothetical protein